MARGGEEEKDKGKDAGKSEGKNKGKDADTSKKHRQCFDWKQGNCWKGTPATEKSRAWWRTLGEPEE